MKPFKEAYFLINKKSSLLDKQSVQTTTFFTFVYLFIGLNREEKAVKKPINSVYVKSMPRVSRAVDRVATLNKLDHLGKVIL